MEPLVSGNEPSSPSEAVHAADPAQAPLGCLELLDRAGRVVGRFPLAGEALRLGRAYDNDVVLDDPYVCPHHLEVCWTDEGLAVRDLESVNGLLVGKGEKREARALVPSNGRFRIGRTTLRFRSRDFPLPPTWVDRSAHSPLRLFERPWFLALAYLATLAHLVLGLHLESVEPFDGLHLANEVLAALAVLLVWAGLWAFPSKLVAHRWNFFIHSGIACAGLLGLGLWETAAGYACFALDLDGALPLLENIGYFTLVGGVVYAHLSYVTAAAPLRLARWALAIALVLVGLEVLVAQLEQREFSDSPNYTFTLKPPAFRWAPGATAEEFFARAEDLRRRVDAEGAKKD